MRKIAIYGKGGIGKSTIASHLAAAWAVQGYKVMLIGCDPKADSTRLIMGERIPSILDNYENIISKADFLGKREALDGYLKTGYAGILCMEIGGPKPGVGCAGRGISLVLEFLNSAQVIEDLDFVIFDVLGDVVCGGFAVPMRLGYAEEVYIVTSGEYAALYAANNICRGIVNMPVKLGGIIGNCRGLPYEEGQIKVFAESIGSQVLGTVDKSSAFPRSEIKRKTLIESHSDGPEAQAIFSLAQGIEKNIFFAQPTPIKDEILDSWAMDYLQLNMNNNDTFP